MAAWQPVLLKASGAPKCKNAIVYMLNNSQVAAAGKAVAAPRPLAYAVASRPATPPRRPHVRQPHHRQPPDWFGHGSIQQLPPLLLADPQPTLLFSCRSFLNGPVYAGLRESLAPLLIGTEIVSHEASPQEIDAGWRAGAAARRVVAIGGGSVLDAAKAFSALVEHPLPTLRYMEKVGDSKISGATLPLIAIPTTAGTGSEVTQNAVITDTRVSKVKASLRHNNFVPHTAILDPQLLAGAPDKVLAYCAIDAFTHLFEAYLSKTAGAMTRDMSLSGIRHFLAAAGAQPQRRGARSDYASFVPWGLTLSAAGLGSFTASPARSALRDYHHGRLRPPAAAVPCPAGKQRTAAATRADGRTGRAPVPALAGQPRELPDRFHHPPRHRAVLAGRFADFQPELAVALEKSNSKNSWIDYAPAQRQRMIEEAFRVE